MEIKIKGKKPEIRFLYDMKKVLYDQKWLKKALNFPVYYIYRGVKKRGELRYDITIILHKVLGQEFLKTKGHKHQKKFGELLEVLEGKALYLFQKSRNKEVTDCYVIKAEKGDYIIVPANYHHLTINPSKKKLIMGNWISEKSRNVYDFFERLQGACYYYTKSGWIKNRNYKKIPKLRFKKPLKKMPKNLDFLK